MQKILIVDDAEINRSILASIFESNFEVYMAADGEEACAVIDSLGTKLDLIFLDLIMPKKDGLEVLAYMRRKDLLEHIPVIMITGEATVETDLQAYEYGAADIIYKPFSTRVVMRRAMNLMALFQKREKYEEELKRRTEELMASQQTLANTNEFLLDALGSVVEFRSMESGEHIQRVKRLTWIMLRYVVSLYPEYKLDKNQLRMITSAAALHDVGKIGISDAILNAPRRLTAEEFETMKNHTTIGCEVLNKFKLQDNDFFKYCYEICRWHHEKVDGRGYPDGLKEDEIPIYCQVVSIVDCFDALASKRVYKDPVELEEAFDMICRGECGAFSEKILNCFRQAKYEMFKSVQ